MATGVLFSLAGFAATAFGVATPVAPGTAVEQRVVSELVQPQQEVLQQLDALAAHTLELNRSTLGRASDTADSLLARLGVSDASAAAFLRRDRVARELVDGRAERMFTARSNEDGRLLELVARAPADRAEQRDTHFVRLTVRPDGQGGWVAQRQVAPLEASMQMASGTIERSFWSATDEAGVPEAIATQMSEMFAGDLDFHRELRKGDTFSVVYETLAADGEPVAWNEGAGRLVAGEVVSGGRTHQAMWVRDTQGRGAWVDLDGSSRRRAFLASPMEFSRVTSGFAMRFHPILQTHREHKGVDYAAPVGTPVRTVGDGTVEFAGWQNGYGNVVEVRHADGRSTLYAHLSRIDVSKGQRVEQGVRIGAVGSTGWSTGPHLHFEFRINGQHVDPLVAVRTESPKPPVSRHEMQRLAGTARVQLAAARQVGAVGEE